MSPAGPAGRDGLAGLVGLWVEGWARCRSSSPWVYDGSAWVVDVIGSAHRSRETFVVSPSASELADRTAQVAGLARTWLTVLTPEPVAPPAAPGVAVPVSGEALMTTVLAPLAPPRYAVSLAAESDGPDGAGGRALASVVVDGEPAAEGTVGVVGETAVFDRIRTFDAFRRRGIGTDVMAALTTWALERGATTGILAASADGQLLYGRLGWTDRAALVTIVGVPDPA